MSVSVAGWDGLVVVVGMGRRRGRWRWRGAERSGEEKGCEMMGMRNACGIGSGGLMTINH